MKGFVIFRLSIAGHGIGLRFLNLEDVCCMKKRLYLTCAGGAQRKVARRFVLIRGASDDEKDKLVGQILSLFCCIVNKNKEGHQKAPVHFMNCVPSLGAANDASGTACLRCTAAEDGENEIDADRLD